LKLERSRFEGRPGSRGRRRTTFLLFFAERGSFMTPVSVGMLPRSLFSASCWTTATLILSLRKALFKISFTHPERLPYVSASSKGMTEGRAAMLWVEATPGNTTQGACELAFIGLLKS
jgi:hypothetical protein